LLKGWKDDFVDIVAVDSVAVVGHIGADLLAWTYRIRIDLEDRQMVRIH
jgi:hypothetical protein